MYAGVPITCPACVCSSVAPPAAFGAVVAPGSALSAGTLRPDHRRLTVVFTLPAAQVLGEAPVHDLHLTEGAHHDVGRLQVAVDDAPAVREAHRLTNLEKGLQQPRLVGVLHLVGEGAPGDQLHGQEGRAVGQRSQGVHWRDAGVGQPGGDLRLAHEAVAVGAAQQHLEGHVAVQGHVKGAQDAPHAAASDLAQHAVAWHDR